MMINKKTKKTRKQKSEEASFLLKGFEFYRTYGFFKKTLNCEFKTKCGYDAKILDVEDSRGLMFYHGIVYIPQNHFWVTNMTDEAPDVHGGVTYTLVDKEGFIGIAFDTDHAGDREDPPSLDYVKKECESLAKQLKDMENNDE